MRPVGHCGGGVVQCGSLSEADGGLAEGVVDFEDFGAVDALGVLVGACASLRDVPVVISFYLCAK